MLNANLSKIIINTMSDKFSFDDYVKESISVINSISALKNNIIEFSNHLTDVILKDKKIMFCGNGGSAADAQHLAAELIVRLRSDFNRKAIPALALTLDTSTITACSNDYSFDDIFSRAVEAIGKKGDALFAISTSGESNNILKAIKTAKEKDIKVFSLLGKEGGHQLDISDFSVVIPSDNTAHIQEAHICIGHIVMHLIEEKLLNKSFI